MTTIPAVLRELADWCERHNVAEISSAHNLYDPMPHVNIPREDFVRIVGDTPPASVSDGAIGTRYGHAHDTVDGVVVHTCWQVTS